MVELPLYKALPGVEKPRALRYDVWSEVFAGRDPAAQGVPVEPITRETAAMLAGIVAAVYAARPGAALERREYDDQIELWPREWPRPGEELGPACNWGARWIFAPGCCVLAVPEAVFDETYRALMESVRPVAEALWNEGWLLAEPVTLEAMFGAEECELEEDEREGWDEEQGWVFGRDGTGGGGGDAGKGG